MIASLIATPCILCQWLKGLFNLANGSVLPIGPPKSPVAFPQGSRKTANSGHRNRAHSTYVGQSNSGSSFSTTQTLCFGTPDAFTLASGSIFTINIYDWPGSGIYVGSNPFTGTTSDVATTGRRYRNRETDQEFNLGSYLCSDSSANPFFSFTPLYGPAEFMATSGVAYLRYSANAYTVWVDGMSLSTLQAGLPRANTIWNWHAS